MVDAVNGAGSQGQTQTVKLNIKKDQGITQALFDQVKSRKMTMSDGSISRTEWGKALEVLNQIQSEREASGSKGIFRGGVGNDGHQNYLVDEGDIEFTQAEMDRIYNALGVSGGSDSVEGAEQPAKTGGSAKTTTKTETKPTDTSSVPNGMRTTYQKGVFVNDKGEHFKYDDKGQLVQMRDPEGYSVVQVNKDGSYHSRGYAKDDNGKVSRHWSADNKLISKTYFNAKTGKKEEVCEFKNGKHVKSIVYNSKGQANETAHYDSKGRKTYGYGYNGVSFKSFNTRYLQDGTGISTYYRADGSKYYWKTDEMGNSLYECDAKGNKIQ